METGLAWQVTQEQLIESLFYKSTQISSLEKLPQKYPSEVCTEEQPWFGFSCRLHCGPKYKSWQRLKRNPTRHNGNIFKCACKQRDECNKQMGTADAGRGYEKKQIQVSEICSCRKLLQKSRGLLPSINKARWSSSNIQKTEIKCRIFSSKIRNSLTEPNDLSSKIRQ